MKHLYSFILFILALLPVLGNSQTPAWKWSFATGGSMQEGVNAIASDQDNNTYSTGYFQSSVMSVGAFQLTNSTSTGDTTDVFLVKNDSVGNVLWAKSFNGKGYDEAKAITVDQTGSVYIAGTFSGNTITFGTTVLSNQNPGYYNDIFLVKLDPQGNVLWARSWSATGSTNTASVDALITDDSGHIVLAGSFSGLSISFDGFTLPVQGTFIAKFDNAGSTVWATTPSAGQSYPTSLSEDGSGNLVLSGYFYSSTLTFGPITLNNSNSDGSYDMFVVKYNSSGSPVWARSQGGSKNDDARAVTFDSDGNVYVAGTFVSPQIVFGNDTLVNPLPPAFVNEDLFLVKYDGAGNYLWSIAGNGDGYDIPTSMAKGPFGDVYLAGSSFQTMSFGSTVINGASYIMRLGSAGNTKWVKTIEQPNQLVTSYLAVNADSNIVVGGRFWCSSIAFGTSTYTNNGASDNFVAVLSKDIVTSTTNVVNQSPIGLYPNPSDGHLMIMNSRMIGHQLNIRVRNVSGQIVYEEVVNNSSGNIPIDLTNVESGIYFVEVASPMSTYLEKLVLTSSR